ncbi:hypothetical protein B0T20DRAFT_406743 [Sordaria brevicollis]|uniref:Uncharacterized protein n=1 Tax=Sordaria brevicollis TaxID=83679 RepID=A0AAE0PGX3_SORBR|nr:hypothetical protein B0T20DRAFT_406743 [Sordaria brevicollis]
MQKPCPFFSPFLLTPSLSVFPLAGILSSMRKEVLDKAVQGKSFLGFWGLSAICFSVQICFWLGLPVSFSPSLVC